jgi:hypothetical protein
MKTKVFIWSILFVLGFCSLAFAQTQTGSIRGYVVDERGEALPGVNVTISSPNMMGKASFVTSDKGEFRFPSCPPGEYVIKAEVQGFQILERKGIVVHVGATVEITLDLIPSEQKVEISVTASPPIVDTTSSKTAFLLTNEMLRNLPINRNIYETVQHAPAVVEEGGAGSGRMVSIHGGTLHQTTYAMDGVNMSDPYRGYISKGVVYDSVEEVEMMTGGISAEIGQMAGGYINVVSKSGGNEFSGSLSVQYNGEGFSKSTLPKEQSTAFGVPESIFDKLNVDASATLGGPIIKDRLWFFLSPQYSRQTQTTSFIPFTDPMGVFHDTYLCKRDAPSIFGKLSGQISSKLKFMGMWQYLYSDEDPNWNQVSQRGAFATYEALPLEIDRSHVATAILTYIIDQSTFAEFRGGFVFKRLYAPTIADINNDPLPAITDRATGQRWGSYGGQELQDRYKWNYEFKLTKFLDNFLGANHELKVGAEYGHWRTSYDHGRKMAHSVGYFNGTPWYYHDTQPYVGRITLNQALPMGKGSKDLTQCWRISAFIQDNVSLGKRLTLNLGLRYDHENASRPEETRPGYVDPNFNGLANILLPDFFATYDMTAPEIKDFYVLSQFQPRIGFSYDIFGDGKTAFKASFARYYESILGHNLGSVHPFDKSVTFYWYDLNKDGVIDLPPTDNYRAVSVPRLITDPKEIKDLIDPNLKAPYVDELITGVQHELFKDFSLSAQFIYKENKNLQENLDLANPIGGDMWLPYTVTEPGDDRRLGTGDDQALTVYGLKRTADSPLLYRTNIDALKRKYWAVELTFYKRMSNNWQFSGSVTHSKQYGNIGSGYYDSIGNRGVYADPNNLINAWGRGTWDRPLHIKLMGTVKLPYGFNISTFYRYMSGAPVQEGESGSPAQYNRSQTVYFPSTVNGFAVKNASVKVKAEPIGSKRNSPTSVLDLRVEKTFRVPFGALGLYVDVFNALGSYRFSMDQDPGGYIYADGSFSGYPTYGRVLIAEGARVVKLTLRYTFGK